MIVRNINEIKQCLSILKKGGTIIYPTDTIWGIGCDATNESAIEKIYKIKKRDRSQSMLILVSDLEMAGNYVNEIPQKAIHLMENSEKPITIIYSNARNLPGNILANDGSIGIRIPRDEFCLQLIQKFGKPLVSTSANLSGKPFPGSFSEIEHELLKEVNYVVKWRQTDTQASLPSSIFKIDLGGVITTIRK